MAFIIIDTGEPVYDAVRTALKIDSESGGYRIVVTEDPVLPAPESEGVWCDGCLGHEAGLPGVRWPTSVNSDDSHQWVERCDTCQRFDTDADAARALAENYGDSIAYFIVGEAVPGGCSTPSPFIDRLES